MYRPVVFSQLAAGQVHHAMSPQQTAAHYAHQILTELIQLGIAPPETEAVGICIRDHLQVVVRIAKATPRPAEVPIDRQEAAGQADRSPAHPSRLRAIEKAILEAATPCPVNVVRLARLTRRVLRGGRVKAYSCSSHFRAAVAALLERGLLVRVSRGIRLPIDP
jgi:hypothetical protein